MGSSSALSAHWKHCSQCGLLYNSPFSKRSYFGHQVPLASTTLGSLLATKGGTMGEKWWPNGAWDMHPGFFYMPQICDMGPIILLSFRRKACWGFLSPFKNPTASAGFEPANLGIQRPARKYILYIAFESAFPPPHEKFLFSAREKRMKGFFFVGTKAKKKLALIK